MAVPPNRRITRAMAAGGPAVHNVYWWHPQPIPAGPHSVWANLIQTNLNTPNLHAARRQILTYIFQDISTPGEFLIKALPRESRQSAAVDGHVPRRCVVWHGIPDAPMGPGGVNLRHFMAHNEWMYWECVRVILETDCFRFNKMRDLYMFLTHLSKAPTTIQIFGATLAQRQLLRYVSWVSLEDGTDELAVPAIDLLARCPNMEMLKMKYCRRCRWILTNQKVKAKWNRLCNETNRLNPTRRWPLFPATSGIPQYVTISTGAQAGMPNAYAQCYRTAKREGRRFCCTSWPYWGPQPTRNELQSAGDNPPGGLRQIRNFPIQIAYTRFPYPPIPADHPL
ncbi:hypothetical protein NA57DRAFT_75422 [Rhizodiscina lignyota]|uniref:Uncharacterized protein n=1 Tax=Rhizodiscina lignyota TaxID=1504668 RepID=A0A9P4IE47_9PEZI|nr:hypothetical protein NA57DRAFT_75422 [Rhizodiscina lignyota]